MIFKTIKTASAALVFSLAFCSAAARAETLRIGTEGVYRPWTMTDADGAVRGFDADVGNAVCQKMGAQCVWQVQNLETLAPALAKGRFDMVLSSLSVTAQRARQIDFSRPYARSRGRFIVRQGAPLAKISDKAQFYQALAGKAVGAEAGTIYAQYLEAVLPNSKIQLYSAFDTLLTDLNSGRLDAALEDETVWSAFWADNKNSGFIYASAPPPADDKSLLSAEIAVGLPKGDDALRRRVNAAICALEADGTVKSLSEKWFGGADVSAPCGKAGGGGAL